MNRSNFAFIALALSAMGCGCVTPVQQPAAQQTNVVQADDGQRQDQRSRTRPLTNHPPTDVIALGNELRDSDLTIGEFEAIARVRVLPNEYEEASKARIHDMGNQQIESDASSELVVALVDGFRERQVENPTGDATAQQQAYQEQTARTREIARQLELLRRARNRRAR